MNGPTLSQVQNNELLRRYLDELAKNGGAGGSGPTAVYTTSNSWTLPNTAFTIINFNTKVADTHNAVTVGSAWKFTVPAGQGGLYLVASQVSIVPNPTTLGPYDVALGLFVNGTEMVRLEQDNANSASTPGANQALSGSAIVQLAAGDTLDIRAFQSTSGDRATNGQAKMNRVSITRIQDSAGGGGGAVYPSAMYTGSTTQSVPNAVFPPTAPLNFETKVFDTHNAVTTGAGWKFTVPAGCGGTYLVSSFAAVNVPSSPCEFYTSVFVNGAYRADIGRINVQGTTRVGVSGAVLVSVVAGDTIDVRAYQAGGGVTRDSTMRNISITRMPDAAGGGGGGGASVASDVAVTPSGNLSSTNVQAALQELQGDVDSLARTPVRAFYKAALDQSITTITDTTFNPTTKIADTHNAVSAGTFTVPAGHGGYYALQAHVTWSSMAAGKNILMWLELNGAEYLRIGRAVTAVANSAWGMGDTAFIHLAEGDTIRFRVRHDDGISRNLQGNPTSWFSIAQLDFMAAPAAGP